MNSYVKQQLKSGAFFFLIYTVGMTLFFYYLGGSFLRALTLSIIAGLPASVTIVAVNFYTSVSKGATDTFPVKFDEGEEVKFKAGAIHTGENKPASGQLILTDKRLIFKSRKIETNRQEFAIELGEISKSDTFKTFYFLENGLRIFTSKGKTLEFLTRKPQRLSQQFR